MGMSSALESLCGIIAPPVVGWLTESAGTYLGYWHCTALQCLHSTPIVSINGSDSMRV